MQWVAWILSSDVATSPGGGAKIAVQSNSLVESKRRNANEENTVEETLYRNK